MNVSRSVQRLVQKVDRRKLTNNTQRVLLSMLSSQQEWMALNSFRVPSASSRLRDLRKSEFGGFRVQCTTATTLNKQTKNRRATFYRLDPNSVTMERVTKVFEGVI